ncbi:MAG: hypothetical protein HY302_13990 [Opitutae bacterium]|nr:hypothetical protein [Opitutae bacterium]
MKKTTKKTIPAATKSAPAPKNAAAAPAVKAAAPVKKATPAKKKAVTSPAPGTFITAKVNIGFGNHLYLRGEGPGLSWDHGIAMDCTGSDLWTATLKGATIPVTFKVLVNDVTWCAGNDFTAEPGTSVTVNPVF